ncbi:MAG: MAPEG family protein [Candidatus Binatia bacterium]|nr:MAPEG family protein [Candidatus Binatia bacterium]
MTTPLWCVFVASLLPYVLAGTGAYLRVQQLGKLDANHPRVQALQLGGIAARALGAQANSWEAFAVFTAAVLTAHVAGADPAGASATLAITFVVARVAYAAMYLADIPSARTGVFLTGWGCCLGLFYQAATA